VAGLRRYWPVWLAGLLIFSSLFLELVPGLVPGKKGFAEDLPASPVPQDDSLVNVVEECRRACVAIAIWPEKMPPVSGADPFQAWRNQSADALFPARLLAGVVIELDRDRQSAHILTSAAAVMPLPGSDPTAAFPLPRVFVIGEAGPSWPAEVIASDPLCGLALLKVKRSHESAWFPHSAAEFAPEKKLNAGEFQLVAGNPAALAQSGTGDIDLAFVTRSGGSANSPSGSGRGGNSSMAEIGPRCWLGLPSRADRTGSPVFNLQGQLTGVVPFQRESLSYLECLPWTGAMRRIVEELKQGWEIRYGDLGAVWEMRTHDAVPQPASGKPPGGAIGQSLIFQEAIPGSPAARAGLQRGDVLLTLNGQTFRTLQELEQTIALIPPGTVVQLTLFRPADQQARTLSARLTRRRSESAAGRVISQPRFPDWRGMRVDVPVTGIPAGELTDDVEVSSRPLGVVVTEIVPDGPAARAGLKPDDWIFQVGSRPIESPEEFYAAVATWSGSTPLTVAGRGELLVEIP